MVKKKESKIKKREDGLLKGQGSQPDPVFNPLSVKDLP